VVSFKKAWAGGCVRESWGVCSRNAKSDPKWTPPNPFFYTSYGTITLMGLIDGIITY